MTEAEWLAADDPSVMLLHLRGSVSGRKLRLFAVACCRRIAHRMLGACGREAIETAARYADGIATNDELSDAHDGAMEEWDRLGTVDGIWWGPEQENPFEWVACETDEEAALQAPDWAAGLVGDDSEEWQDRYEAERAMQVPIFHDIVGNPFRPVILSPTWLVWRDGLILSMAQRMYDTRDFGDMPILADALEEAGCTNPDILNHCRQPSEHVRGCWVIDLLLGKN